MCTDYLSKSLEGSTQRRAVGNTRALCWHKEVPPSGMTNPPSRKGQTPARGKGVLPPRLGHLPVAESLSVGRGHLSGSLCSFPQLCFLVHHTGPLASVR